MSARDKTLSEIKQHLLMQNTLLSEKKCKNNKSAKSTKSPKPSVLSLKTSLQKSTVTVHVGNVKTNALVDTGADVSCVHSKLLAKLEMSNVEVRSSNIMQITGVGGECHNVKGEITLPLTFGDVTITNTFLIFDNLHHALILGRDFLVENKVEIDFSSETMTIPGNKPLVCTLHRNLGLVRPLESVVIEPDSSVRLNVSVSRQVSGNSVLLEPTSALANRQLLGARCLVKVHKGCAVMEIMNPTKNKRFLSSQLVIATVSNVHQESIVDIDANSRAEKTVVANISSENSIEFDLEKCDLTVNQKEQLHEFLYQNRFVFSSNLSQIGQSKTYQHQIDTGNALPVRGPNYRTSPNMKKEIERQVDEMLQNNIIEPSNSDWYSPVVLVPKKNGEFRFAIDYRKLNKVTRPASFPLPKLEDVVDAIGEADAKIFSVLDLASGFWQIPMDPSTKHKAAFITHTGIYEWTRMPFGLRNAPITFQMVMTQVLRGLHWKQALVYVDDILIYSKNFEAHLHHLKQVFHRLQDAGLTLKPSKCQFAVEQVSYLGHRFSKNGVMVDPSKIALVQDYPVPKNQNEIRSFMGLCNYYRKFVNSYSIIASPLNELLQKNIPFEWTTDCQKSFETLKASLSSAPVLAYPNMSEPFILTCDASASAIGFILGQLQNGKKHPVAYGGRSLNKAERKWGITDRECLAVIEGIKHFRVYLANNHFKVITDHRALKWLQNQKDLTGRLGRWALRLQEYDFEVVYRPGVTNQNADAMSRRPYSSDHNADDNTKNDRPEVQVSVVDKSLPLSDDTYQTVFTYEENPSVHLVDAEPQPSLPDFCEIGQLQRVGESKMQHLIKYLETQELPDDEKLAKTILYMENYFVLENNVLYHFYEPRTKGKTDTSKSIKQLWLPETLRTAALQAYHDNLAGGCHLGITRTHRALQQKYFWHGMYQDVHDYISSCDVCQRIKRPTNHLNAPLQPLPISDTLETWHIDFLSFNKTTEGYQHVLVVTDSLSKWIEAFPTKTQEASEVAWILYAEIFARYGAPVTLVSDRGKNFMSKLVSALCEFFKIKKIATSPYHPQSNSPVERYNSVISQCLRAYIDKEQNNWPKLLPSVLMSLRRSPCTESTQYSPYKMLFGKEMNLAFDTQIIPKETMGKDAKQHFDALLDELKMVEDTAKQNVSQKREQTTATNNVKSKEPSFRMLQQVLVKVEKTPVGFSKKLHAKWEGPYYIVKITGNNTYGLRKCSDNKLLKASIHANRLKAYHDPQDRRLQPVEDQNLDAGKNDNELAEQDNQLQNQTGKPLAPNNTVTDFPHTAENANMQQTAAPSNPSNGWFPIKKIVKSRYVQGKRQYLVDWEGKYAKSWLQEEDLGPGLIREYHATRTMAGKKRKRNKTYFN